MKERNAQTAFPRDERGFTLLEAVVAMSILAAGILTVCMMQVSAMRASATAYDRTEANSIATALIESFQSLPYDDSLLDDTADGGDLPSNADDTCRHYVKNASKKLDRIMRNMIDVPSGAEAGVVEDKSGTRYNLSWAVQEETAQVDGQSKSIRKTIRVFMDWKTPMGTNHLDFITSKYPNNLTQ